jgi:hypothetical protein
MSTPLPEIRSLIRRHAGPGKIASAQTGILGLRVTAASVMTEPVNSTETFMSQKIRLAQAMLGIKVFHRTSSISNSIKLCKYLCLDWVQLDTSI